MKVTLAFFNLFKHTCIMWIICVSVCGSECCLSLDWVVHSDITRYSQGIVKRTTYKQATDLPTFKSTFHNRWTMRWVINAMSYHLKICSLLFFPQCKMTDEPIGIWIWNDWLLCTSFELFDINRLPWKLHHFTSISREGGFFLVGFLSWKMRCLWFLSINHSVFNSVEIRQYCI